MEQFNVGETVQLVSDGPVMTISVVFDNNTVRCQWFAGKKLESGNFPCVSLRKIVLDK
ncbi:YodC family protein [Geomonas edaphica]|uniref:YodC family protein n=1 Tax=Geomonas edaphica TaxID=2570226 RepID=UPI0010A91B22|nr:DUF2158 domain-containing protein [Geomonas edaphica]